MNSSELAERLRNATASGNFDDEIGPIADALEERKAGVETIDVILRFMEDNPNLEYGTPGPLVHFMEKFYRRGYEDALTASVLRRPMMHTIWMLNRLINGASDRTERQRLIDLLEKSLVHPLTDAETKRSISHFRQRPR
jgi:hypothetical protein